MCYTSRFYLLHHIHLLTFFFFNDTATTEIYTLSLHDALPIWIRARASRRGTSISSPRRGDRRIRIRSEEHTSELQSQSNLVCRLLLEKKKKKKNKTHKIQIRYHLTR